MTMLAMNLLIPCVRTSGPELGVDSGDLRMCVRAWWGFCKKLPPHMKCFLGVKHSKFKRGYDMCTPRPLTLPLRETYIRQ